MIDESYERLVSMMRKVDDYNNKEVMEALTWMVLGDGSVERPERGNCRIAISHIVRHTDYLMWKASIIERVTGFSLNEQVKDEYTYWPRDQKVYKNKKLIRLRSNAHPWFTKIRAHLYPGNNKTMSKHAIALLGPIGLAILYQDDGSLSTYVSKGSLTQSLLIHTLSHSYFELQAFAKHVVDNFGLIFRINEDRNKGNGFRLRLRNKDIERFIEIIEPYVVPSMLYKIGRGSDGDNAIGDIVWTSWQQEETSRNA